MIRKNYYTSSNYKDHTKFSGIIYNYDFNEYNSMVDIAAKIESDKKFDKQCERNIQLQLRNK